MWAARPDEYGDVLNLWATVFGLEDLPYLRAYLEGDPWLKEPHVQVALSDGKIVFFVYIGRRPMRLNGEEIALGRIESVATLPEHRRRGLSTELLRRSVEVMEAEGFAFSSLNTGNHSHYKKHGYNRIPLPKYSLTLDETVAIPDADPDVQPLSLEQWLEEAPPVYAAFNETLPLYFERSPEYWNGCLRLWLEGVEREKLLLLGLRRNGVLEG